jgi:dUTP pyrophosphatase
VKNLNQKKGKIPSYHTPGSIGLDVPTRDGFTLMPGELKRVDTGLQFNLPEDIYIDLRNKSGLAAKSVDLKGCLVDSDYRGNVFVIMHNFGSKPVDFIEGQNIAQIVFVKRIFVELEPVLDFTNDDFEDCNERGDTAGFKRIYL